MCNTVICYSLWEVVKRSETNTQLNGSNNMKAIQSWQAKHQEAQAKLLLHIEPLS